MSTVGKDLPSYPEVTEEENGTFTARFKDLTIKGCLSEKEAVAKVIHHYHSMVQGKGKDEQDDSGNLFKSGFFKDIGSIKEKYHDGLDFYPEVTEEEDHSFTARCKFRGLAVNRGSKETAIGAMTKWYCELSRSGHFNPNQPDDPGAPPIQHVLNVLTELMQDRLRMRDKNRQELAPNCVPTSSTFDVEVNENGHLEVNLLGIPADLATRWVNLEFLNQDGTSHWADIGPLSINLRAPTISEAETRIARAWDLRKKYLGLTTKEFGKPAKIRLTPADSGDQTNQSTAGAAYTKSPHFIRDNEVISGLATAIAALARVKEL